MTAHAINLPEVTKGSPDRFGYSWDRYADVLPEHEEQFLRWTTLDRSFWQGVRFVDGGCGIGRNSYWPMSYGAQGGVAVDVDDRTLGRARHNLAPFPNLEVRKQSIYEITEQDAFDVAFSIGVVHHLSDPDAAVARLTRAGEAWRCGAALAVRPREQRLDRAPVQPAAPSVVQPPAVTPRACAVLAADRAVVVRLAPGSPRGAYYRLIRRFSFEHLRAIVFDHMIPRIALYYTRGRGRSIARTGRPDRYSLHLGQ